MNLPPIADIAASLGLGPDLAFPSGRHRAKISLAALDAPAAAHGRYVLVTAVTPTGAGEGKTVTTLGLAMGLRRRGHRAVAALRQSSLGPTFGLKGGGGGGGLACVEPREECLLGLGLDLGAVEAANNLLATAADDAMFRDPDAIDPETVALRRVVDMNDRALRHIRVHVSAKAPEGTRTTGFDITAASEVMAVLAISRDLADLRARVGRMVVGFTRDGAAVSAEDLKAAGAMATLLRDALQPNLMQTADGTPVLLHAGPFANIAFGNSSVVADRIALPRADFVITEGGFGADLGAEKFLHLKCAASGLRPDAAVVVATVRALRHHGQGDDLAALEAGGANLARHVAMLRRFGLPVVVAVNRFPDDRPEELAVIERVAAAAGASATVAHTAFVDGADGCVALADAVHHACTLGAELRPLYAPDDAFEEKVRTLATLVYGAREVAWEPAARASFERFSRAGYGHLPVCVAKTHTSLSHDPRLLGAPEGFVFPVRDLRLYAGAGYITLLAGSILTMPGMPEAPRYAGIDVDAHGRITGLL